MKMYILVSTYFPSIKRRYLEQPYRDIDKCRVRLDPGLVSSAPKAKGTNSGRSQDLYCQNGVDLADELVANVNSGLGHATAKLYKVSTEVSPHFFRVYKYSFRSSKPWLAWIRR